MYSQWGLYLSKRNIIIKLAYKLLSILTFIFPKNFFAKIVNKMCRKNSLYRCKTAGVICHYKTKKEIVDSSFFKENTQVYFENNKYNAPKEYKKYLDILYGKYKEKTHHIGHKHFKAYWK